MIGTAANREFHQGMRPITEDVTHDIAKMFYFDPEMSAELIISIIC